MIEIHISKELTDIVPEEDAQSLAEAIAKMHRCTCVKGSLVPVSREPEDERGRATGCAVLTLDYGAEHDQDNLLCYIYAEGYVPGASHIAWTRFLKTDCLEHGPLLEEVRNTKSETE